MSDLGGPLRRLPVETAIETGMRWGELIALRPRHIDFLRKSVTVEETIIEVSKKHSLTGERYVAKPYPKDNEPRTFGVDEEWFDAAARHIKNLRIGRDQLLFTTSTGSPKPTRRTSTPSPEPAAGDSRPTEAAIPPLTHQGGGHARPRR